MHVLVLPSWFPTAHAPRNGAYFYQQLCALRDAGHRIGVVYPEHHSLRGLSREALATHRFQTRWHLEHGLPVLRRHGWNMLSNAPGSYALCIRAALCLAERYADSYGRPDVIHALSAQWAGAAAAHLARRWNRPMALTEHFSGFMRDALTSEQRYWARTALNQADAVAAVSPALRTAIRPYMTGTSRPIRLLPNPIDLSFFSPPAARPAPPPVVWASVGRLVPLKGTAPLLRAIAGVRTHGLDVRLHVVGDGPERTRLQALARDLGLRKQVQFHGTLPPKGVRKVLQQAHGYVLASHYETFGIPVVEALACGCAVLATRCGGPEYVLSNVQGQMVPPRSMAALQRALLRMTRALQQGQSLGPTPADRKRLHNRFSYDTFVTRTINLYQNAKRHWASS
ncbi:hypothetical protein CRI93_10505 [Longimonas halophila]|uniref:Glycosyl transferase family 1 n=1 Tax=Longimonas halophila TaxID=1469170 RepID=A0A2H3NKK7_9BACT|nr:glycosyltransferase [Longimonas halophila]PEN06246.1 hypothetical protein CRI93_10505 [Longimonas halophila]